MAKYKLTVVYELEDNEGVQSESELNAYIDEVVKTSIGSWDKVDATLLVNDKDTYKAEKKAIDKEILKTISMWPWHCSANSLPTEQDKYIIACVWDNDRWREFGCYQFDHKKKCFENDDCRLKPSPNVYWRIVAEPEPPKPRQHDSDR